MSNCVIFLLDSREKDTFKYFYVLLSYLTPALSPCDSCFKAQFLRRILLFSWDDIALCRQKTVKKVMTKDDFVAKGCNNLR